MPTITTGLFGGEMHGVAGNAVFVRTKRGTVVRDRTVPRNPETPAVRAVRLAQGRASSAWKELEPEAAARWTAYARRLGLQPNNAFSNLYKVLLRLDPAAPVPLTPPARPFFGDVVEILAPLPLGRRVRREDEREEGSSEVVWHSSSGGRGGVPDSIAGLGQAEDGNTPTLPSPKGEGSAAVRFASRGANAPGIVTELLVQPLASRHRRTYLEKYRHAAYVAFAGAEEVTVPVSAGWVALAYRFVNAETGQVTALAELGTVRAG